MSFIEDESDFLETERIISAREALGRLVEARDFLGLRKTLAGFEIYELAHVLTGLPQEVAAVAFRVLPRKQAGEVFSYLDLEEQRRLLAGLGQAEVAEILDEMPPDDRTALLDVLPAVIQRQLLSLLKPAERQVALTLLGYEEGTVGRIMTPGFVALHREQTVDEALMQIREHGRKMETFNVLYVVDENSRLVDELPINELLLASPSTLIGDLVDGNPVALLAEQPAEEAVKVFQDTDLFALPVTTRTGKILGIVTMDDVIDLAEARATQTIQRFGGNTGVSEPYLKISWSRMMLKRGPWLVVLFLSGLLTANAMAFFEGEIERAAVLMVFLPLVIASGGNSGSQAATLVIRALATGDVRQRDAWVVLAREAIYGCSLGLMLGAIGFVVVAVGSRFTPMFTEHWALVGLSVGVALLCVVLWGSVVGSMLPLILRKCRLDPATSSAPFVSTLVDVTGIVIYFTVASAILRGSLL